MDRPRLPLVSTTGVAVFAAGVVYWPVAYDDVAMWARPFVWQWLGAGAVSGMVGRLGFRVSGLRTVGAVAIGFAVAVAGRAAFDIAGDATIHNLLAIEIVTAMVVGGMGAAVGAWAGGLGLPPAPPATDEDL